MSKRFQDHQELLPFFDSAEQATDAAILRSGMAPKTVAHEVWPAKGPDGAHRWLLKCLNEGEAAKMTADEHLQVAKITGRYEFVHYVCAQTSHATPHRVTPEDQKADLQRQVIAAVGQFTKLIERLEAT